MVGESLESELLKVMRGKSPINTMETADTVKLEVRKLSSLAVQMKMDLHDLSEELPQNWEMIPKVAEETYTTYQKLAAAKKKLAELGG